MQAIRDRIPDHAKDLRLNLDALTKIDSLTPRQLWGTALAAALATRNDELVRSVAAEARAHLDPPAFAAARTAAALMGMNNVRPGHAPRREPRILRAPGAAAHAGARQPGRGALDFELWALAVSAVHGCGTCLDAHEQELRQRGASALQVQDALRIAAVLHAVAGVLDGEDALAASDFSLHPPTR